ncbi:calcium:proton antiporter [Xaviernesmea oryzae]|uniref:Calcium:proton antiporter n=1 Tax=Xaviernesmea oryzae TaxID=464029 RepID=A0A1Q9ASJ2_9HYPH|nr:calcium:proton antiporter [Xaviernesmea oryzae]OLP58390.1 calcium:proton antiporter [Xaviernesmea oryzae]
MSLLRSEWSLLIAIGAALIGFAFEHSLMEAGRFAALAGAGLLVAAIIVASMRVAHHAEMLAVKVGDPYGTMILTLSAVLVEVVILAILMSGESSPTLVRDTIYAAVMLDINGILGLAALLGGLKHGEQPYNDDSSRTYSVMILTAMGISMIVPEFVPEAKWHFYSGFTIVAMVTLYAVFLRMQVGAHSYFFSYSYPNRNRRKPQAAALPVGQGSAPARALPAAPEASAAAGTPPSGTSQPAAAVSEEDASHPGEDAPAGFSIAILVFGVVIIGILAELMSALLTEGLRDTGAPPVLTALVVATISAAPEIMTAMRAALANRMQAVVNIALGASLSTVILTVSVMEAIALFTGQPFIMAMTPVQTVMVTITLIAAAINLNDGETNAIEGMTHFVLFATFIMLSVLGL